MLFRLLACVYVCHTVAGHVVVATSLTTPAEISSLLSPAVVQTWLPDGVPYPLSLAAVSDLETIISLLPGAMAVLDVSFSSLSTQTIAGLCSEYAIPHLVFGLVSEAPPHKWTFYVNGRQQELATALEAVLRRFEWNRVNIVTDSNPEMLQIPRILSQKLTIAYKVIEFPLTDTASIDRTVGKVMRMSGNRITLFVTRPELTAQIITAQFEKNIGGEGFANLISPLSSLFPLNSRSVSSLTTGNLILAEAELASAGTKEAYYSLLLSQALRLCVNHSDSLSLLQSLEDKYPSHYRNSPYCVLNVQRALRTEVGEVANATVALRDSVYFLGNSTAVPTNAKSPLWISANFGVGNVDYLATSALLYYNGGMLAVADVNSWANVLENFYLELFNFTAGVTQWSYNYAYSNVFPYKEKLGYAVLAGVSSGVTMNLIKMIRDFGFTGPVVGSSTTVNKLSGRKDYPTFVRTILPDSYINRVYVQMFKRFGWTQCGLFVSNETWGLGFQQDFTNMAADNGITILNDPALQVMPTPIPDKSALFPFEANLLDFIATKARILIIVVNNNAIFIVDYLYDLGLRGGDVQVVANEWLSFGYVQTNDTEVNKKRSELLRGAIQFSPIGFVGKFGAGVYSDYQRAYGGKPSIYSCFFYDSALAVALALDLVIREGQDYTDSGVVLKALRGSRFVGCTGTVTFDPDTNDRSPMPYNVLNAQFGANDTLITDITTVGKYDPTSSILFSFYSDIIWCDGTTAIPKDIRQSTIGCPFEDKYSQDFPEGRFLLYGVCAGVSAIAAVLCAIIWKVWWNHPTYDLHEQKELQVQDVLVMLGIAVELVQYISIGPDLRSWLLPVAQVLSGSTLSLEDFITFKDGGFGKLWLGVFSTILLWILMCFVTLFHIDDRWKSVPGCRLFGDISELTIPFVGNLLFLPIVSVLLDVFACTEGLGLTLATVTFQDSYLRADCFVMCWRATHTFYVIGSSVALLVYLPAAILFRPLWQELEPGLNIKTTPLFLMVKTVVQVCFIVVKKTVRNAVVHCCVFIGLMTAFIGFSLRWDCFNYKRTALWHVLSLIAVLLSSVLKLIQEATATANTDMLLGAAICGWAAITTFGLIYQKLRIPSLLYRKPGVDTQFLFRFAFQRTTANMLEELDKNFQKAGNRSTVIGTFGQKRNSVQPGLTE